MSMTKSRDRADATREAASTRRARPTGRGGPRFLPYSGVNQPSHGGTGTPTVDPAGVRQASAGPARPPTDVYQPSLGANPLRRAQPRFRAGVLHPFNYTTRKYVPQAHNPPPNGGRSRLGDARALGGNLAAASEAYDRACRLDPDALGACYNLAETLRARGDAASAEGVDSALHLWTRSLDAYRHVLQQFGDYRQARRQEAALRRRLAAVGTGTR